MLQDRIVQLRQQGMSLKKIAKSLGCSSSTVSKWCAILRENKDIIASNMVNKTHGTTLQNKHKIREFELLRQLKPDDPSWFNAYKFRVRQATKAYLIYLAGGKCQCCGYNKCSDALSFHHVDRSTKTYGLSGTRLTYNLSKILRELQKCCLVCHNCHTEIHSGLQACPTINIKQEAQPESVVIWWVNKQLEVQDV